MTKDELKEASIDRLIEELNYCGYDGYYRAYREEIIEVIKERLERPKGKWIPGEHECPCCGEDKFKDLDADIWADWYPSYCPNCGAKMEVEE